MLNAARRDAPKWERELAKYGLSKHQLKQSGIQQLGTNVDRAAAAFPHAHDPEVRAYWKYNAVGLTWQDMSNMSRVPVIRQEREVPEWALSDAACCALLLHLYPTLNKTANDNYLILIANLFDFFNT